MNLKSKRVLFFSPKTFGYEGAIKQRLEQLGATVDYYDDRPSNGFWGKALLRFYKKLMTLRIERYYRDIYKKLCDVDGYDYIFLLNLEAMPIWFLKKIKERFSAAQFILYMWDSFWNKVHTKDYLEWCDRAISFDYEDHKNSLGLNGCIGLGDLGLSKEEITDANGDPFTGEIQYTNGANFEYVKNCPRR